jgi:hypothetical protein
MAHMIYRGYDIEVNDKGTHFIYKDGLLVAKADNEQAALDYINIEKKKQREASK